MLLTLLCMCHVFYCLAGGITKEWVVSFQATAMHARDTEEKEEAERSLLQLQKEVNSLQFDLEHKESRFTESQQTWSLRLEQLTLDNTRLASQLTEKEDHLKDMRAQNASE